MTITQVIGNETDYEQTGEELKEKGIYRVRYAHPDAADLKKMEQVWDEEGCTTISTWGQFDRVIASEYRSLDGSEYPIELSEETLSEEFTLSGGSIDWDGVRDAIAENVFDGNKAKAGQARGSLNRFVEAMTEGTRLLATGPSGTRFGIVSDDRVYYDPTHRATEWEKNHMFYRPVTWLRDEQGELLTIEDEDEYLPSALQPTRLTNTEVDDEAINGLIKTFAAFDFMKP